MVNGLNGSNRGNLSKSGHPEACECSCLYASAHCLALVHVFFFVIIKKTHGTTILRNLVRTES